MAGCLGAPASGARRVAAGAPSRSTTSSSAPRGARTSIAHNAVLRALYAYCQGVPRERCPYLPIPLHTVIELTPHAYGCHETRVPLEPRLDPS